MGRLYMKRGLNSIWGGEGNVGNTERSIFLYLKFLSNLYIIDFVVQARIEWHILYMHPLQDQERLGIGLWLQKQIRK